MIRKILFTLCFLLSATALFSQEKNSVEMADIMRSNGKIYVVVAVILTIFAMLIIYIIRLDRKISKLEKNINS